MLSPFPDRVIIIIGAARSGTKFLREILSANKQVCAIQYDVNHIWKIGHQNYAHDEIPADECSEHLAQSIQTHLLRAANIRGNVKKSILVEKTVSNSLRVDFVRRVFPRASYIHLVRDGRAVVESAYRQWIAKPDIHYLIGKVRSLPFTNIPYLVRYATELARSYAPGKQKMSSWGPRYCGIDEDVSLRSLHEVCAIQWAQCVERATKSLGQLNTKNVLITRYEDFVSGPEELKRICDFLQWTDLNSVLNAFSSSVQSDNVDKWRDRLDVHSLHEIMPIIQKQLQSYGYF